MKGSEFFQVSPSEALAVVEEVCGKLHREPRWLTLLVRLGWRRVIVGSLLLYILVLAFG